jgi:hypothetical protein
VKQSLGRILKPNLIAFGIFITCFTLHIVGGQLDLDWLFAAAVVLIWASAAAFPLLVHVVSAGRAGTPAMALAVAISVVLTAAVLRATRNSGFEALDLVAGAAIVLAVNGAALVLHQRRQRAAVRPA